MLRRTHLAYIAFALALLTSSSLDGVRLVSAVTDADRCKKVTSCKIPGPGTNYENCTITERDCPPCMAFSNNYCYAYISDGVCSDFATDCGAIFEETFVNGGPATEAPATTTPAPNNASNSSASGSGSGNSPSAGVGSEDENKADMPLILGIIGGCIAVIAVAVIFFVLVRRSRARDDDEVDDEAPAAQMVTSKAQPPQTSTAAVNYAAYGQRAEANPTTPTSRVIQYYQDNALPSPHGSRAGGGFGGPQQGQASVKTVRPSGAANAPTFFKPPPTSSAASVASYSSQSQNVYAQPGAPVNNNAPSFTPAPVYAPAPAPTYGSQPVQYQQTAYTTNYEGQQSQVRQGETSPRGRKDSFEF